MLLHPVRRLGPLAFSKSTSLLLACRLAISATSGPNPSPISSPTASHRLTPLFSSSSPSRLPTFIPTHRSRPSLRRYSTMVKAAITQITSTADVTHNLRISEQVVRGAVEEGAKVIFLPEAADFIIADAHQGFLQSPPISRHPYVLGLQKLAKELQVTILASIHDTPEDDEPSDEAEGSERVYNTQVVIGPDGVVRDAYRKIHLFDVALTGGASSAGPNGADVAPSGPKKVTGESARIIPGSRIHPPIDTPIGKIGLEICYDIRFPEIHTILTRLRAQIISLPSAFTLKTGRDHWYTLVRAVAIQYQVYVFAAAQVGAHSPARSSWGEALVFDPWGRELARLPSIEQAEKGKEGEMQGCWKVVDVEVGEVDSVRGQIPLEGQKRTDVYGVVGEGKI